MTRMYDLILSKKDKIKNKEILKSAYKAKGRQEKRQQERKVDKVINKNKQHE